MSWSAVGDAMKQGFQNNVKNGASQQQKANYGNPMQGGMPGPTPAPQPMPAVPASGGPAVGQAQKVTPVLTPLEQMLQAIMRKPVGTPPAQ